MTKRDFESYFINFLKDAKRTKHQVTLFALVDALLGYAQILKPLDQSNDLFSEQTTLKIMSIYLDLFKKLDLADLATLGPLIDKSLEILNHHYYKIGNSLVADEVYDQYEDLVKLSNLSVSNLDMVGFGNLSEEEKIPHVKKMLSLNKMYNQEDVEKWIGNEDVLSIFKIDGSSCSIIYEEGKLTLAKTRGDGLSGENITAKVKIISDIPDKIRFKKSIEVRGEIFCTEENFIKLATEMRAMGLMSPTSQRNIVAGLLGRKEKVELNKYLSFNAFEALTDEGFLTEHEKLDFLKSLGFSTPDYEIHKLKSGLNERIADAKQFMSNGDYLIDGLVFIYDKTSKHYELGETSKFPKYKVALKFAGDTQITTINKIEWNVSRNGVLTPVAVVTAVELSGAQISRVTLHNYGLVKNLNLKKGDTIQIIRSGEVIPKFLDVVSASTEKFSVPGNCPSCKSSLIAEDIWLVCINDSCPEKIKAEILHYIRKAGVDDISDKRLEELIAKGFVQSPADLYRLKHDYFLALDKVKDKLALKMYENIQKTKSLSLSKFISAIGVEGFSNAKIEKVIDQGYNSLEKILGLSKGDLIAIEGFAEKSSREILKSLKKRKWIINELIKAGVKVEEAELVTGAGNLNGLKFCITGQLTKPRSEIEKLIKLNGGSIVSSVSKNTSFVVTNEIDSNSSKFIKAKSLEIPIIDESKLQKMIEG